MRITIGNKIKCLRKQKGVTQEKLAESIGISFQAVSKWENEIAYPDVTLIPSLANYFNVSIDELFNYNLAEQEERIHEICSDAYQYRENNPTKAKEILEEGLRRYPDHDLLLNHLLYVLDYSNQPDITINLANKLIEQTNNPEIKYDAMRFLAYAYNARGEDDNATAALEQIPELYFTKLSELAFISKGTVKYEAAYKQKWISLETLIQMMCKTTECYIENADWDRAIQEIKSALCILERLAYDEKIQSFQLYKEYLGNKLVVIQQYT